MVRFLVNFTAARHPGTEDEADDFTESFLGFLLNLATAKDKAVRFRVCQIVAGVLNSLGPDAEISDDLYERMEEVMLERLRDKAPSVRAQAARALSRLQDSGEGGDFSEDAITTAFLQLLGAEKVKDVRKAILGSLAISDHTIPHVVERTRDAADDVRRVAFLALTSKVPVDAISIALRATAIRRGLAERSPAVRAAAVDMLKRWHLAFEGDVLALLAALDAESNERVAEDVVKELIACGKIKPAEVAQSVANGNPPGGGLRRVSSKEPERLMSPEAAVYWRVVCEHLHAAAHQSGATAATAVGQNQVVSAAVAGEKLEALESALPATASDLLALISDHADAGARFVARQLLPLLELVDLADATARRGAAQLVDWQLRSPPTSADDAHFDVAGVVSSYAFGGSGAWERALVRCARLVRDSPADAAAAVLAAADALRVEVNTDEAHAQALFLCTLLLEDAPRSAIVADAAEAITASLIRPGVTHASAAVRREAIKTTGLLGILTGVRPDGECVRVLRAALAADAPAVRCVAAKALGDLALLYGPAKIDALAAPSETNDDGENDALTCSLEAALLSALDEPAVGFEALDENAVEEEVDVTGGAAAAEAEAEGCVGTAAAEALVKLILRRGPSAFADAPVVVAKLLAQYFGADQRVRPRLSQCLAVFFPALASAPEDRRRLVADAALLALRALSAEKGVAKVASYLAHLLQCAPAPEEGVPAPVVGGAELVVALVEEAFATVTRPITVSTTSSEKTLMKAYIAALAKLAAATTLAPTRAASDYDQKSITRALLARGVEAAEATAERVVEKMPSKDLAAAVAAMRVAIGDEEEEEQEREEADAAEPVSMEAAFEEKALEEEEPAEEEEEPAEEEELNEEEAAPADEEAETVEAPADEDVDEAPAAEPSPEPVKPAKRASRKVKTVEEPAAAKSTRSRRGALKENVAH